MVAILKALLEYLQLYYNLIAQGKIQPRIIKFFNCVAVGFDSIFDSPSRRKDNERLRTKKEWLCKKNYYLTRKTYLIIFFFCNNFSGG